MNENTLLSQALLSQEEIDALVNFLTNNKKVSNEVLDQESIDRLIKVLSDSKFLERSDTGSKAGRFGANSVLSVEKDIALQREQCVLSYEKDEKGNAHVFCVNHVTGAKYEITPECLGQSSLVESTGESWGRAVMPALFDLAAMQLQVKYTSEIFSKVCGDFAELIYGDAEARISNVYLPSAARILENIGKES
ncbi:MAG: hypothetical protein J1E35_09920 [Lachnospiraceae bacterium]|nr:hypothetical protein [Lachnospiraceae bacterium]